MQTFNIENQAFYRTFSMENDLCPSKSSHFFKNNQKSSYYRADYLRQRPYLHVDSFSRKFDPINLQTFNSENMRFKVNGQSE